eukprot:1090644-Rhodomonas_salina.2
MHQRQRSPELRQRGSYPRSLCVCALSLLLREETGRSRQNAISQHSHTRFRAAAARGVRASALVRGVD